MIELSFIIETTTQIQSDIEITVSFTWKVYINGSNFQQFANGTSQLDDLEQLDATLWTLILHCIEAASRNIPFNLSLFCRLFYTLLVGD